MHEGRILRVGLPESGAVFDQDAWTAWAFACIEGAVEGLAADLRADQRAAQELAALHAKMRSQT